MKYLFFIILGLILISIPNSFSLLEERSSEELYESHHTIVIGNIISSEIISQRETLYEIKVTESIKNSQKDEIISAIGKGIDCNKVEMCMRTSTDRVFDVGDTIVLYLNHNLIQYEISPYSRVILLGEEIIPFELARPGWYNVVLIGGVIGIVLVCMIILFRKKENN